jgi:hypothetical protein
VGGGVLSRPLGLPTPSFILSRSSCTVSGGARPGSAEDLQAVGDHAQPDPALHPGRSAVPTAPQPMTSLESTDAPLAAGAPAQGRASGAGPRGSGVSRQHDVPHVTHAGRVFLRWRGKPTIGHRQLRGPAEEGQVAIQRGHPEGAIGHPAFADLVVGDELGFRLLDLHQAAELGGLGQLALAEDLGGGSVDQVAPHLAFTLVEAPVVEVLVADIAAPVSLIRPGVRFRRGVNEIRYSALTGSIGA